MKLERVSVYGSTSARGLLSNGRRGCFTFAPLLLGLGTAGLVGLLGAVLGRTGLVLGFEAIFKTSFQQTEQTNNRILETE